MRRWLPWVLVLALVVGAAAWLHDGQAAPSGASPYLTATARRGNLTATVSTTGSLEPVRVAELTAVDGGQLTAWSVTAGERVQAEQVLGRINDAGGLATQVLQMEQTLLSDEDAAQQTTPIDAASLRLQVKIDQQSLDALEQQQADNTLTAPAPGEVTSVAVKTGQYVTAGQDLLWVGSNPHLLSSNSDQVTWGQNTALTSPGTAQVARILVQQGDLVHADEPVLVLDDPTLGLKILQARQTLAQAQALAAGAADPAALSAAILKQKIASDQQALAALRADEQKLAVRAPFAGIVESVSARGGQTVTAGAVLATVADASQLELQLSVDELDVDRVKVGQPVAVTITALPGRSFTGKVTQISRVGKVSNGRATYAATVVLPTPSGARIGMAAEASIDVASAQGALIVPVEAIHTEGGRTVVVVKTASGFATVPVTTGLSNTTEVQILSGLGPGEVVVTSQLGSGASTSTGPLNLQGKTLGGAGSRGPGGGPGGGPTAPAPGGGHG